MTIHWILDYKLLLLLLLLCPVTVHLMHILTNSSKNAKIQLVTQDRLTMLTLFKAIVLSRLDYASQLWSPSKIYQINLIEKVERTFTKHITEMHDLSYNERLKALKLYSLQRRRERYCIIYVWKVDKHCCSYMLTLVVRLPGVPGSPRRTRRRQKKFFFFFFKMFNGKDSDMLVVIVRQYCSA